MLAFLVSLGKADEIVTAVVGFNVTDCPAGSDTIVSVPFHRPVSGIGTLTGVPQIEGDSATVMVAGSPEFADGRFTMEPHFLRFTGGSARAGWHYLVSSHGLQSLVIDLGGDDLAGVADGDAFELVPYWTLASLFPTGNETIHESTGLLLNERATEVFFFDRESVALNLAPNRKFFRIDIGWREVAPGFPDADHVVVTPGTSFVIRHPAVAQPTRFTAHQWVETGNQAYVLATDALRARDHHLGSARPVPVKLADLDLEPPVFVESASTDPGDRADELHVFDNTLAAVNRQAAAVYFRAGGQWVRDESGYPASDNVEIDAGVGLMIRKAPTAGGTPVIWVNTPRY